MNVTSAATQVIQVCKVPSEDTTTPIPRETKSQMNSPGRPYIIHTLKNIPSDSEGPNDREDTLALSFTI
jgi:hypothetical protein